MKTSRGSRHKHFIADVDQIWCWGRQISQRFVGCQRSLTITEGWAAGCWRLPPESPTQAAPCWCRSCVQAKGVKALQGD